MAFEYAANGRITCPKGDTGTINICISGDVTLADGDVLVWGVFDPKSKETLLRKDAPIVNGKADIRLTNADTRTLEKGAYKWNARIVTDPELDLQGLVVCADDTDNVLTIFNKMPDFIVVEAGVNV